MRAGLLVAAVGFLSLRASAREHEPIRPDGPPDADQVYVITKPEVPVRDTAKTYAGMKPVTYVPPKDRWEALPKSRAVLARGGQWRVVMLGDSIVNDTSRSNWSFHLGEKYPKVQVVKYTVVRGGTGCDWYEKPGRVRRYVLDFRPALVMIGGISQPTDAKAVRNVVRQIRKASGADILLMTGPFGRVDPNDARQWRTVVHPAQDSYEARLAAVAKAEGVGFLDLQRAWGEYVRASGKKVEAFRRDAVHANRQGEQILGRILVRYFAPDR
jgi:hypothetical protein